MPVIPFNEYTIEKAREIVGNRFGDQATKNLNFLNGNHWGPDGDYWIGPRRPATDPLYGPTMQEIERAFISHNVIAEVTGRHTAGVLSRELHWKFTVARDIPPVETVDPDTGETIVEDGKPNEKEESLISEAEAALTEWWDKREVPEILQYMLDGALNIKRSPLRLYVPPDLRDDNGNLPRADLSECLDYIWLQSLVMDEDTLDYQVPSATVYTDKRSRRDIGVFTYKEDDKDFAELTYLDENGNTVLRIIGGDGEEEQQFPPLPLGGRLLHYEMTRKALVTKQIISQQMALNMAMTMKQRNAVQGGFLERILFNVAWPVEERTDPVTGQTIKTPQTMNMGPGTTNNLQGVVYTDPATGQTTVLNPSVQYRDPVSPDTFISTEGSYYLSILQEAQQLHYALAGDAVVSGESRTQARDAFQKDLQLSAGKVEAAARWVLETALAMASYFAGKPGRFEELRAYVTAHVDSGPVSADEKRVSIELVDANLNSRETGMSNVGVEDVDAEMARIDREQAKRRQAEGAGIAAVEEVMNQVRGQNGTNGTGNTNGNGQQAERETEREAIAA